VCAVGGPRDRERRELARVGCVWPPSTNRSAASFVIGSETITVSLRLRLCTANRIQNIEPV
jgi:hypothetical protein